VISVETRGPVAVLQMTHGKANTLDTALCQELVARLGDADLVLRMWDSPAARQSISDYVAEILHH
jgi:hypothetical protein